LLLSDLLLGLLFSSTISTTAYLRGSLTLSGIVGAILVGTITFAAGGLSWAILLIAFFLTSSALSHYKSRTKEPLAEKFQKGYRRDLGQVLANGGWGAVIALALSISPQPVLFFAFVGAMATVTADTWATELGVLSARPPRLITNGRVVSVGTSGGITFFGTLVALVGATFVGLVASLAFLGVNAAYVLTELSSIDFRIVVAVWRLTAVRVILLAALGGLAGALFDSLLGATVQAIYFCDADQKETESRIHQCGHPTRLIRGWRWLDNDWVNFLASVFGSVSAGAGYLVIG
jgi:uncharacterized protein (TIGR00297 family)